MRRTASTAADGVGAREWLEMGGEKKPLEISELGCADGCGREMGAENCVRTAADGVGAREWMEMGWEKNKMQPTNPNAHTYGIMDMQSLRTIFCNSLFEQFCIYIFPLLPVCSVEWAV